MNTVNILEERLSSVVEVVDQLERELSSRTSKKSDNSRSRELGELSYRVIHLKNNPSSMESLAYTAQIETLRKENERLKARLDILESGTSADISRAIDTAINSSELIDRLRMKLVLAEKREENLLSSFRKSSLQFREACYLLFGWRIDALKDGIFRLSNMYAENENDNLLFEIQSDGTIQLLENEYVSQLSDYITTYLENAGSFPAFLASITLDLFKLSTQIIR